jgi:lipid-binding SYLF domain-containing protein
MKRCSLLLITFVLSLATADAATEQQIVNQSATILRDFRMMPEKGIPGAILRDAKGLAIITVVKVGFG